MILIISTCKEKLHELEFVQPIKDIIKEAGKESFVVSCFNLKKEDVDIADKIIICGTSLRDEEYLKGLNKFELLKYTEKPVLGICAGMQVISLIFGGRLKKQTEIGMTRVKFEKGFLGLKGEREVYGLHNYCALPPKGFEVFAKGSCVQAIKHKEREIYGVLFHPEVRQNGLTSKFVI